jgi:hypothetical protein
MKECRKVKTTILFLVLSVLLVSYLATLTVPYFKSYAQQNELCTYYHLLIIYPNTDVTYFKDGMQQSFKGSMGYSLKTTIINAFKNLPILIENGSAGVVSSTYDIVEVSHPVSKITSLEGNCYWLSPQEIEEDLKLYAPKGKYDSVHVVWYNGPIDSYFGLGGIFINDGTTTFSSLIAGQEWWWTGIGEALGEPFLHEWLHGVCRFYATLGYTMPEGDADGADEHGYTESSTEGWMKYYRDLMQGKVWEPKLSKYTGITKEAWSKGTPRGLLNISVDAINKKILVNVPEPKYITGTTIFFISDEFLASYNTTIERAVFMIDSKEITPLINRVIDGYTVTFTYTNGIHIITMYATYELKIKVLDHAGNPVPEAMLNLTGPLNEVSKTNSYGIATFSKLISGNYSISALFPEIVEEKTFLIVNKSQDLTLGINIKLFKSRYEELQNSYSKLQEENKKLNATYNELKNNYNSLKASYETLQNNFEKLQKDYEGLGTTLIAYGVISIAIIAALFVLFYRAMKSKGKT